MTVWLLGGLDPTGGAGLLRDWATARAVRPSLATRSVATALTVQGHGKPAVARPVAPEDLRWQLEDGPRPTAIKIGLVPQASVEVVADFVRRNGVPTVLDPVLVASDGGALGSDAASLRVLAELATLTTPNRAEAAALRLNDNVLCKDSPTADDTKVCDVLVFRGEQTRSERPRDSGPDPRGTGCALATAITMLLADGATMQNAVAEATTWLHQARTAAFRAGDAFHLP